MNTSIIRIIKEVIQNLKLNNIHEGIYNYVEENSDYIRKKLNKILKNKYKIKKPLSAYIFFCNEKRPIIKDEMPHIKGKEVMKELGRRWKKTKTEKKEKKYLDLAQKAKEQYEKDMAQQASEDEEEKEENSSKKVVKEINEFMIDFLKSTKIDEKIIRPYIYSDYVQEKVVWETRTRTRPCLSNLYRKTFMLNGRHEEILLGQYMDDLVIGASSEEARRWFMERLEARFPINPKSSNINKLLKIKNKIKKPLSAYIFFCNEKRPIIKDEMPHIKGKEVMKELGRRWKKVKTEKKEKKYLDLAQKAKEQYEKDMAQQSSEEDEQKKEENSSEEDEQKKEENSSEEDEQKKEENSSKKVVKKSKKVVKKSKKVVKKPKNRRKRVV